MNDSISDKIDNKFEEDEERIVRALDMYYSRFETSESITFAGAAILEDTNPAYMVNFIVKYGLGMPEDREDAEEYLHSLRSNFMKYYC